jgi:hypothetical protein
MDGNDRPRQHRPKHAVSPGAGAATRNCRRIGSKTLRRERWRGTGRRAPPHQTTGWHDVCAEAKVRRSVPIVVHVLKQSVSPAFLFMNGLGVRDGGQRDGSRHTIVNEPVAVGLHRRHPILMVLRHNTCSTRLKGRVSSRFKAKGSKNKIPGRDPRKNAQVGSYTHKLVSYPSYPRPARCALHRQFYGS